MYVYLNFNYVRNNIFCLISQCIIRLIMNSFLYTERLTIHRYDNTSDKFTYLSKRTNQNLIINVDVYD